MDLCFAMQSKTVSSQESLQTQARQAWDDKTSKVNSLMSARVLFGGRRRWGDGNRREGTGSGNRVRRTKAGHGERKGMIPRWKYWEGQSRKDQEKQLFGIWHRKSQKCRQFYEGSEVPTLAVTFLLSAALHSNFLCSSSPTKKGVNISHYVWNYLIGGKKWGGYPEKETQKNAFLTLNYLISMRCNLIFLWQSSFITCSVHLEHTQSISV